jgi:hypothetical protein
VAALLGVIAGGVAAALAAHGPAAAPDAAAVAGRLRALLPRLGGGGEDGAAATASLGRAYAGVGAALEALGRVGRG